MWIFVHFDLPTNTKEEKKAYSDFRKFLIMDGFTMMQFSMYVRHCSSRENATVHKNRLKLGIPPLGHVIIFEITDAQFGNIEFFIGDKGKRKKSIPQQLELF